MNWDRIAGNLKLARGMLRMQWGRITHDHLSMIDGRQEMLTGRIQRSYGQSREATARQLRTWKQSAQGVHMHDEEKRHV